MAERDRADRIAWPAELLALRTGATPDGETSDEQTRSAQAAVAQAMADQTAQFQDRRQSLLSQSDILTARITQLRLEIEGTTIEKTSTTAQLGYIRTELAGVTELLQQKLVQVSRVLALERERARLEGVIGRLITDQAKTERAIAETDLQIHQLQEHFQEEVASSLVDTRRRLGDVRQKLAVADDVLRRVFVTAPLAGSVQGLRVAGPGQVIRPGEALLEIVPTHDRLQIDAHFQPANTADLRPGQQAEVRFPAFPARVTPVIMGRLESISHDRLIDETTHEPYFLGIVSIDPTNDRTGDPAHERAGESSGDSGSEPTGLPPALAAQLRAGMPAEVVVPTGERTVMSYLTEPLSNAMRRTFVEK